MIRVLIASRRTLSAELLAGAIRVQPRLKLVELVETEEEMFNALSQENIDIALLNVNPGSPADHMVETLKTISTNKPKVRVIVLCEERDPEVVVTAFRGGAKGVFSLRDSSLETLCKCVERVHDGQIWANSQELEWVMKALESSGSKTKSVQVVNAVGDNLLSQREEDVVRLLLEGLQNREIARALKLSEHTIKNYLFRIYEKLGISSRTELLLYVMTPRETAIPKTLAS